MADQLPDVDARFGQLFGIGCLALGRQLAPRHPVEALGRLHQSLFSPPVSRR